jgi:hypothetical protein
MLIFALIIQHKASALDVKADIIFKMGLVIKMFLLAYHMSEIFVFNAKDFHYL